MSMTNLFTSIKKGASPKIFSFFTIAALIVSTAGITMPQVANAVGGPAYSIGATSMVTGSTVSLSGTASGTPYVGQLEDHNVTVTNWGDASTTPNIPLTIIASSTSPKTFSATWAASHTYSSSGTKTITATLHHANLGGNESGDATLTLNVVIPPTQGGLIVNKVLINDDGGTTATSSFALRINGATAIPFESDGSNSFTLTAGAYTVTEVSALGYTTTYDAGCTAGVAVSATTTCTITNNDQPGTLVVTKILPNNNGGTSVATNYSYTIDGGSATTFESDGSNSQSVDAGTYTVAEVGTPILGHTTTYGGDCSGGGIVTVGNGQTKICTITNDDIAPILTVVKTSPVTNDNGGTKGVSDFSYFVGLLQVFSGIQNAFFPGTYTVSETGDTGYSHTFSDGCGVDGVVTLALGENKTCTITNDDNAPSLTLQKVVIDDNDANGTTLPSEWTLTASGPTGFSGAGPTVSNGDSFDAGIYNLSESGPAGYTGSDWVCVGGPQTDGDTVTVGLGANVTCTITNNDNPLPICSNNIDDDIDGLIDAADPGCYSGNDIVNGTYNPNGATEGDETTLDLCKDGIDNDADGFTDLDDLQCAVYMPKIIVQKTVVNDNGGTKTAGNFIFQVNGTEDTPFIQNGENPLLGKRNITLSPGTHTITEIPMSGYTSTPSGDCSVTIAIGETKYCSFTNDDQPTILTVIKNLINNSGKTNATSTFSFLVNYGDTNSPYLFDEDGIISLFVAPGIYGVTENNAPGYTTSYAFGASNECSGIALALGGSATCTITNNDIPACSDGLDNDGDGFSDSNDPGCFIGSGEPQYNPEGQSEGNETTLLLCTDGLDNDADGDIDLEDSDCEAFMPKLTVKKVVINDNGGTGSADDFFFQVNGGKQTPFFQNEENPLLGERILSVASSTYTITEITASGYATTYENCSGIELAPEDTETCTITNNDIAPEVTPPPSQPPPGNGPPVGPGGIGVGGQVLGASIGPSDEGTVLGVSTEMCSTALLHTFLRERKQNDSQEVTDLQQFLNDHMVAGLPVTGFFGPLTTTAVNAFQLRYAEQVLTPWLPHGLPTAQTPTGYVYKTTQRWINLLYCASLDIPMPQLP